MSALVEIKDVCKVYNPGENEVRALDHVSLTIDEQEFVAIIGHSGSGKSTLIQHFNALIQPTSGTVSYNGEDVWAEKYDRRKLRSEVGLVFQYPEHQLFESDVLSDVCFGPMNQGMTREQAEEEARKALHHVGFKEENFDKSPFELSGGQKKRVAIAGVLAMKDVAKYAERLIVVNHGQIAFDDTPKKVFAHYKEMEPMGLAAPQITYIMHALKEKGLNVDPSDTTVEEAKQDILNALRKMNSPLLKGGAQND